MIHTLLKLLPPERAHAIAKWAMKRQEIINRLRAEVKRLRAENKQLRVGIGCEKMASDEQARTIVKLRADIRALESRIG